VHGTIAKLHVVTPPGVDGRDLVTTQALLRAGAPLVQVRTKGVDDRARLEVAAVVVDAARASGATCLVNDRSTSRWPPGLTAPTWAQTTCLPERPAVC